MGSEQVIDDEDSIGIDDTAGRGIVCRVQCSGESRRVEKTASVSSVPGSAIRVSIGSGVGAYGKRSQRNGLGKKVARLLAYVDPLTGKLVVRMGMYDISKHRKGVEVGPQVVWESDSPICKVGRDD